MGQESIDLGGLKQQFFQVGELVSSPFPGVINSRLHWCFERRHLSGAESPEPLCRYFQNGFVDARPVGGLALASPEYQRRA